MGAMAGAAGVRTPAVVFAGQIGNGVGIVVQRWVHAVPFDQVEVDDELAQEVWAQVYSLHAAGIAHGDIHAGSILVDGAMQPWLVDFSRAQAGSDKAGQTDDIVALRATLSSLSAAPARSVGASTGNKPLAMIGSSGLLPPFPLPADHDPVEPGPQQPDLPGLSAQSPAGVPGAVGTVTGRDQ